MNQILKYNEFHLINESLITSQLKDFSKSGYDIKYKKVIDDINIGNSYDVYWGRNKESNHFLTSNFTGKNAKPIGGVGTSVQDIWLHASGCPGSHVLIKAIKDDIIPQHILKIGAEIAKKNSKAKDVEMANIVWCFKNYVSIYPPDDVQIKIDELEKKKTLSDEEKQFIESNKPSIGRAFIDDKNRNIIRI
jgi:predicted ribosome quality control (RQC) complex YloA/Tae2 family protein